MENITLFHGSNQIVETPELSQGNIHNDYGRDSIAPGSRIWQRNGHVRTKRTVL